MHLTQHRLRRAFTLVELLFVMLILSVLVAMAFSALAGAAEQARVARTKTVIAKLDQLITEKYESYRTRRVRTTANNDAIISARNRLNAIRELMRMEMPDRMSDVNDPPAPPPAPLLATWRPALSTSYFRRRSSSWSAQHQSAECLYLIISSLREGDSSVLEFFAPSEIGDVDEDDMPEFLDAWGQPIEFIRWPAGYLAEDPANVGVLTDVVATMQIANGKTAPDPFDPLKADARNRDSDQTNDTYLLRPLIFSAGRDKEYGVETYWTTVQYSATNPRNDPYAKSSGQYVGHPINGTGFGDNITNHYQEAQ